MLVNLGRPEEAIASLDQAMVDHKDNTDKY